MVIFFPGDMWLVGYMISEQLFNSSLIHLSLTGVLFVMGVTLSQKNWVLGSWEFTHSINIGVSWFLCTHGSVGDGIVPANPVHANILLVPDVGRQPLAFQVEKEVVETWASQMTSGSEVSRATC